MAVCDGTWMFTDVGLIIFICVFDSVVVFVSTYVDTRTFVLEIVCVFDATNVFEAINVLVKVAIFDKDIEEPNALIPSNLRLRFNREQLKKACFPIVWTFPLIWTVDKRGHEENA